MATFNDILDLGVVLTATEDFDPSFISKLSLEWEN